MIAAGWLSTCVFHSSLPVLRLTAMTCAPPPFRLMSPMMASVP